MKYRINKVKRKDDVAYYIATSVRNGKNVSTKNVESLGKESEIIANGFNVNDYLNQKLKEYNDSIEKPILLKLNPNNRIQENDFGLVKAGSIFIKRIFDEIKMDMVLNKISKKYKLRYSLYDVVLFLAYSLIINPNSKSGMYKEASNKSIIKPSFFKDSIYRAMDILEENKSEILKACYHNLPTNINRDTRILYYDCTNTYFESELEHDLRAKGKGKRNEKEPLVSFGLVMDRSGIPLTFNVFKGNQNEQKTLIPLENEIIDDFRHAKFVMITDAGLSSKDNRCFNSLCDRKYITTLPVRCMSQAKLDNYILNDNNNWSFSLKVEDNVIADERFSKYNTPDKIRKKYDSLMDLLNEKIENNASEKDIKTIKDFIYYLTNITLYRRYHVKEDKKPLKYLSNPKNDKTNPDKMYIEENYLISYSLKYELRQRKQREKLIAKAKKLINNPGKLTNNGSNDPKQYITKVSVNSSNGDVNNDIEALYDINLDLINKQAALDGFYCVATNLSDDDNDTIIDAMKYRWFIEDSFKVMKQYFDFRPVRHSKTNRIRSHFTICFLTLLVYRYLQKICHESKFESLKNITDEELFDVLKSYNLNIVKKDFYLPAFNLNSQTKNLEELFNVYLSNEIMTPAYISKVIKSKRNN